MAMLTLRPHWRLLRPTSKNADLPPLLIAASFLPASSSYSIFLTDLTHTWAERLDRRSILRRSLDEETSIDPSEDSEQFRVFLQKLESCLNGARDTSISLSRTTSEAHESTDLPPPMMLRVTAQLPKGLEPLIWPFYLTHLPPREHTNILTLPLLENKIIMHREGESLIDVIKSKDYVIQKLVDKLIASGTELAEIFPGIAGKSGRRMSLQDAERKIKGLARFDHEQWVDNPRFTTVGSNLEINLKELFGSENELKLQAGLSSVRTDLPELWWNVPTVSLQIGYSGGDDGLQVTASQSSQSCQVRPKQILLPRLRSEPAEHRSVQVQSSQVTPPIRDDTESEIEFSPEIHSPAYQQPVEEPEFETPIIPDSLPQNRLPKRRLGRLGGSKSIEKSEEPDERRDVVANSMETIAGAPQSSASSISETKQEPKRRALGHVGGRKANPTGEMKDRAPALYTLGNTSEQSDGLHGIERGREHIKSSPPLRETSVERANRKREELRKELEEKSKHPAKKRRKF